MPYSIYDELITLRDRAMDLVRSSLHKYSVSCSNVSLISVLTPYILSADLGL